MRWQVIPEGPYHPFHDLTFLSPVAAVGCFAGKAIAGPGTAQVDDTTSAPPWLPVFQTVIEALQPFDEARLAVSQAIQDKHPEQFEERSR